MPRDGTRSAHSRVRSDMSLKYLENYSFFVIDVEAVGLYGEGFAVGGGLYSLDEREKKQEFLFHCSPAAAMGTPADRLWVHKNIPILGTATNGTPKLVREAFMAQWLDTERLGVLMFADCGYPVETTFVRQAMRDYLDNAEPEVREEYGLNVGPYPLHEIATLTMAAGMNPLATEDRLSDELPIHNPLCDARQSWRLLRQAILKLSA